MQLGDRPWKDTNQGVSFSPEGSWQLVFHKALKQAFRAMPSRLPPNDGMLSSGHPKRFLLIVVAGNLAWADHTNRTSEDSD